MAEAVAEAVEDLPEPAQVAIKASVTSRAEDISDRAYSVNDYAALGMSSVVEVTGDARAFPPSNRRATRAATGVNPTAPPGQHSAVTPAGAPSGSSAQAPGVIAEEAGVQKRSASRCKMGN